MIKTVVTVASVDRRTTKAGKPFSVIKDTTGKEYSSWTDSLTQQAEGLVGQQVELGYDETTKGQFTNRTVKFIGGATNNGASTQGPVEAARPEPTRTGVVVGCGGADTGDWKKLVETAANRGEWRAAEALLRRQDINRSVALNNTIEFFGYLKEEDRTPANVGLIFDHLLEVLNG